MNSTFVNAAIAPSTRGEAQKLPVGGDVGKRSLAA
jgi:hypothetical protein